MFYRFYPHFARDIKWYALNLLIYFCLYKPTIITHVIYHVFVQHKKQYFHNNLLFQFQWFPSQLNQSDSNFKIKVSLKLFDRAYAIWQRHLNKTLQASYKWRSALAIGKKYPQINVFIILRSQDAPTLVKQLIIFVHHDNCCNLLFLVLYWWNRVWGWR